MNLNYASRVVCNRCGTPPSIGGSPQVSQQLASMAAWGMGGVGGMAGMNAMMGAMGGGKNNARPGDWICPSCNNHNYASRTSCNRCQAFKPENAQAPAQANLFGSNYSLPGAGQSSVGKMRPGDWLCPACNNHNYASRAKCNRCQASKPESAGGEPVAAAGSPY